MSRLYPLALVSLFLVSFILLVEYPPGTLSVALPPAYIPQLPCGTGEIRDRNGRCRKKLSRTVVPRRHTVFSPDVISVSTEAGRVSSILLRVLHLLFFLILVSNFDAGIDDRVD